MPEIQVTLLFNAVVLILITDNNPIVKTSIGRNVPFRPLGVIGLHGKVGCVFPMVVVPIFPHSEFR